MGQSKLPATCSECGQVGPQRRKAPDEGWVRRSYGGSHKADWLCPEHGQAWEKARREKWAREREQRPKISPGASAALSLALSASMRFR